MAKSKKNNSTLARTKNSSMASHSSTGQKSPAKMVNKAPKKKAQMSSAAKSPARTGSFVDMKPMKPQKSTSNISNTGFTNVSGLNGTQQAQTVLGMARKKISNPIASPAQSEKEPDNKAKLSKLHAKFNAEKEYMRKKWLKETADRKLREENEADRRAKEVEELRKDKGNDEGQEKAKDEKKGHQLEPLRVPRRKFFPHPSTELVLQSPRQYAPVKYAYSHMDKEFMEKVKEINLTHTLLGVSAHIIRFTMSEGNRGCQHVQMENSFKTRWIIYHIVPPPVSSFSLTDKIGYLAPGERCDVTFLFKANTHRMPDDLAFCYSIFQTEIECDEEYVKENKNSTDTKVLAKMKEFEDAVKTIAELQEDRAKATTRNMRKILKKDTKDKEGKPFPPTKYTYTEAEIKNARITGEPLKPYVFHVGVAFGEQAQATRGPKNLCGRLVHHPMTRQHNGYQDREEMKYDPDEIDDKDEILASAEES